jgi:ABC-2 type transport system permease protein
MMNRLIRAELLKLRTTQVWFWLLLASVAISSAIVIGNLATNGVHNADDIASMLGSAATSDVAVFVLGALGVTTEFRHQTITATVLVTPSRWTVVTAKMLTYALVGAAYSAVCLAVQLAIALPWLHAKHIGVPLGHDPLRRELLAVFFVVAIYGLIGLGVGAMLRNQIVAVVIGLIFLLVLQGILEAIPKVRDVFPFLPNGASASLLLTGSDHGQLPSDVTLLSIPAAVVVLLLWAIVPAIVGATFSMTRDIT